MDYAYDGLARLSCHPRAGGDPEGLRKVGLDSMKSSPRKRGSMDYAYDGLVRLFCHPRAGGDPGWPAGHE